MPSAQSCVHVIRSMSSSYSVRTLEVSSSRSSMKPGRHRRAGVSGRNGTRSGAGGAEPREPEIARQDAWGNILLSMEARRKLFDDHLYDIHRQPDWLFGSHISSFRFPVSSFLASFRVLQSLVRTRARPAYRQTAAVGRRTLPRYCRTASEECRQLSAHCA